MKKLIFGVVALVLVLSLSMPMAAFAVPQPISTVTVSPEVDQNVVGTTHSVTVDVNPNQVYQVRFEITDGPNDDETSGPISTDGSGVAYFSYVGDGGSGIDEIEVRVTDPTNGYVYEYAYKFWLEDKFSGGGKIVQEDGPKKKDWSKITWGGWAGTLDGDPVGQFEVTFHNVGVLLGDEFDWLDKAKFVSEDDYLGADELNWLMYFNQSSCPDADPPESEDNVVWLNINGDLFDRDGDPIEGDWMLGIRASDNGEPGNIDENEAITTDSIAFALWDGGFDIEEDLVYESYLTGDFLADQDNCFSIRHELDSGNLQIVVPPTDG